MHHGLRVLPGVDQPGGVRVPDLVGGRLERDTAARNGAGPDPVPDLLVQVGLVGIAGLLPATPGATGRGGPPVAHSLAAVVPRPLPAARAPALGAHVAAHGAMGVDPAADRLAVTQRLDL